MTTPATWDRLFALSAKVDGVAVTDDDGRGALAREIDFSPAFAVTYNAGSRLFEVTLSAAGVGSITGAYEPTPDRLVLRNGDGHLKVIGIDTTEAGQIGHSAGRPTGYGAVVSLGGGDASRIAPFRQELYHNQRFDKFTTDAGLTTETREVFDYVPDNAQLHSIELWFYSAVTPDDTDYGLILIESTDMFGDDIVLAAVYTTDTAGDIVDYDRLGSAPVAAFQLVTLTFQPPVMPPYIVEAGRYIQFKVYKGGGTLSEGGVGVILPRIGGHFTYRLTNVSADHPA